MVMVIVNKRGQVLVMTLTTEDILVKPGNHITEKDNIKIFGKILLL